jgi:putative membrane protein
MPDHNPTIDTSTKLAYDRTRLAYERTLMAWVRTGVSLISFGFTIYKFFEEFHTAEQVRARTSLISAREFGLIMISIGLVAVVLATMQHVKIMHRLRSQDTEIPYSLAAVVALLVSVLGILALIAAFFRQ